MVTLVPGVLLKLLQHMNTDVKVAGEHRSSLLQVVSIVPALTGGDLFENHGFYLKVSDSSHATYVTLPDGDDDLILSDKVQLGQYIHVERLIASSSVPILQGVRLIPGRHPCVGTPEDIVAAHSLGFLSNASQVSKSSEKPKSPPKLLLNSSVKDEQAEKKTLSNSQTKSISSTKTSENSLGKKESLRRLKTTSSHSIPSSPTSGYLIPNSFEKFASEMKQQDMIKSDRGTPKLGIMEKVSAKLGLGEKNLSARGANPTSKKQSIVRTPKNLVHVIEMGPKGLRKSWEGNMDTRSSKDNLKTKFSRKESISAVRSSSVPKKGPINDGLSTKVDVKAQKSSKSVKEETKDNISSRNTTANVALDDVDRPSKPKLSVGRKSVDASNNGLSGNMMKVTAGSRKLVDASVLWASLPSSVTKLGKEVLKLRDSAQMAAIEAMQEASAAESILRCLSNYSELSTTAKEDDPQPAVEQFLGLHSSLKSSLLVITSLSKKNYVDSSPDSQETLSEKTQKIISGRRKQAASWANAALSTDLSSFSVYSDRPTTIPSQNHRTHSSNQPLLVLETSSKNTPSKPASKPRVSVNSKVVSSPHQKPLPLPPPPEWSRGNGLDEFINLGEKLQCDSQNWFLGFVERFLDADVDTSMLSDNVRIAGMLTQLKSVNDWLDEIGGKSSKEDGDEEEEEEIPVVSMETIDRLRKKIYEYLLTHVQSAAAALGNGSQSTPFVQTLEPKKKR